MQRLQSVFMFRSHFSYLIFTQETHKIMSVDSGEVKVLCFMLVNRVGWLTAHVDECEAEDISTF